jgi:hypothetical protein
MLPVVALSFKPTGKLPLTAQVYGAVPPVTVQVEEYCVLAVMVPPTGKQLGVSGDGGGAMDPL